jgi:hypothetical protein
MGELVFALTAHESQCESTWLVNALLRCVGKTVELRGHPHSLYYQLGVETQPRAGVMT